MSQETYPTALQAMIDRAGTLTAEETQIMGSVWESNEDLVLPNPSVALEVMGGFDLPVVTNEAILEAWQRALDAASNADPIRINVIDAARAGGRAAAKDIRHLKDSESSKNGAEEAVRSAVLAVGVRDLISETDFAALTAPWEKALGQL